MKYGERYLKNVTFIKVFFKNVKWQHSNYAKVSFNFQFDSDNYWSIWTVDIKCCIQFINTPTNIGKLSTENNGI